MTAGKTCPHCGAALPAEASFCPCCAHALTRRETFEPPRYRTYRQRRRIHLSVLAVLVLLLAAVLTAAGLYLYHASLPKTFEGIGTVTYTDRDGTYELILGDNRGPDMPLPEITLYSVPGRSYRKNFYIYVFHAKSSANATDMFMSAKVNWWEVHVLPDDPDASRIVADNQNYSISGPWGASSQYSLSWNDRCGDADVVWILHMNNGDTIRLQHRLDIEPVDVRVYTPDDAPMDTLEELQATVDQLAQDTKPTDIVELHLPPVTYEGTLEVHGPSFRLYGAEQDGIRTTFEGGIRLDSWGADASELACLDLTGPGTGLVLNGPAKVSDCTFSSYDTAIQGSGTDYLQMYRCTLTGNDVGLRLAIPPQGVSYLLEQCRLEHNDTGVVLAEGEPGITVSIQNSTFLDNRVDVDNQCNQGLNLDTSTIY